MALQLKKAHRGKAFIKIGMSAPSGGGKTLSALLLGKGLMEAKHPDWTDEEQWAKIAIIDTENGSGELYVGAYIDKPGIKIGEYNAITLSPPFEADKYTQAIDLCEKAGMEVCIVDSTTHLWSGEGGLLEQQGHIAKRTGNSYTAWREITPQHNRFVEKMLQTPMHLIATMRAKQEYVQEKDDKSGKSTVRKLGLEPEQRKGMEYEFTIFFEIDTDHVASGAKDRTNLFDQKYFVITPETGKTIMNWLEGGTEEEPQILLESHIAEAAKGVDAVKAQIIEVCKKLGGSQDEELMTTLKRYVPSGNPNSIKDRQKLVDLYVELQDMLAQREDAKELPQEQEPEEVQEPVPA